MRTDILPILAMVLVSCLCSLKSPAQGAGLLEGDFESGTSSPKGWTRCGADKEDAGAVWLDGDGRSGRRALGGKSDSARAVWTSEPVGVEAGKRYVVSGFLKPTSGSAWLVVRMKNAKGKSLGKWSSAAVDGPQDWTYTAVEAELKRGAREDGPVLVQVEFWVRGGEAALDDVSMLPLVPCEFANRTFEAPLDQKGRIPYWSMEKETGSWSKGKDESLPEGTPAGTVGLDKQCPGEGTTSLSAAVTGGWLPVSSAPYATWPWWKRIELTALARCERGAKAQLGIAWFDAAQQYLGIQLGRLESPENWQRISSGRISPPAGAQTFKPLFLVVKATEGKRGGNGGGTTSPVTDPRAWFDAVDVRVEEEPCVQVVVNQVGYDLGCPKQAIVLTNFFPHDRPYTRTWIVDKDDRQVWESKAVCAGRMLGQGGADWGWYVWRCDFSGFEQPGKYRLKASAGPHKAVSNPFETGAGLLFRETAEMNVDFFFVQRCGCEVPGWHGPCHMDDAKLPDGTHRDLTGGWHSAGDYNKLAWEYGDGGVVYALAHAAAAAPQYFAQFDRDGDGVSDVLDEAGWGAKYLAKIQEPSGGVLNHIEQGPDRKTWMNWCPPEKTTDNVVGTADDPIVTPGEGSSPLAIGGWALLGALHPATDGTNPWLANSIRLWEHAEARDSAASSPLLLLSGIDLWRVTREDRYLEYCRRAADTLMANEKPDGSLAGGYGNSGDIPAAALAAFALAFPDDPRAAAVRTRLGRHLPPFLAEAANPFGLMMQQPGPQGYFFDPSSAMGCNYQLCSRAWSALMVYRVTRDVRALRYAMDQIDFLLGRNPHDVCMMEGKGTVNLPRYHHRYITIPGHPRGAVPGTIPNGCVRDIAGRDRPGLDFSTGGRPYPSYRTNEPWLVHNVFYMMAVTALHEAFAEER